MEAVTIIRFDIAKSLFQVHGINAEGKARQLKRRYVLLSFQKPPPCLVSIEACALSHYWSHELQALGHTVRLIMRSHTLSGNKNDAADAETICEAVTSPPAQNVLPDIEAKHAVRCDQDAAELPDAASHTPPFIRQQTTAINAIHAHLAEFGIVVAVGRKGVEDGVVADPKGQRGG
jgi:transposase